MKIQRKIILSRTKIAELTKKLAQALSSDFVNQKPLMISVMDGAVIFAADILRGMKTHCEFSSCSCASYCGDEQGQAVQLFSVPERDKFKDRHVIVIDTILDSCKTMKSIVDRIHECEPASISLCVLINKEAKSRDRFALQAIAGRCSQMYAGIHLTTDQFVVGYGLDYHGFFRNWQDIIDLASVPEKQKMIESFRKRMKL